MMRAVLLRASNLVHAALLRAYPRAFRERFGADMQSVFESRMRARAERGVAAACFFQLFTFVDVLGGGLVERFAPNPQLVSSRSPFMTWDAIRNDVRISFRTMRRSPLFTALAVVALALGIGATAAIFAVVNGVLLRPLPYRDPGQLVMLWSNNTHLTTPGADRNPVSPANFLDYKNLSHSFSDAQAMYSFLTTSSYTDGGVTEIVQGAVISNGMFAMLGRGAYLGRTMRGDEQAVAVLSHQFWMRRYGGDPSVIGRTVTSDGGARLQIVGVMPPDFVFPYKTMLGASGFTTAKTADIWTPMPWSNSRLLNAQGTAVRSVHFFGGVARLKPGVTAADAQRDLTQVAAQLAIAYPQTNAGWGATVVPLDQQTVGGVRSALMLLLAGAGVVLLIVCANVANLVLSRSLARQREFAVRAALGASGRQLARQSLVESFCLAAVSGLASIGVFVISLNLLRAMAPGDTPRIDDVGATPAVFGFMAIVTLMTGALVALLPALASARSAPQGALKDGGRGTTVGRRGQRVRSTLVVAEVALAVMLTAGAGLLLRSFMAVMRVDPGFAADHVLTLKINAPARALHTLVPFYDQLFAKIESIPGVISVGGTTRIPLGSTEVSTRLEIEGIARPAAELPEVELRRAQHNYFGAMNIPVLEGRTFTPDDTATTPRVAVVNETLARRLFPDGDVVGRHVRMGPAAPDAPWTTIIGVIGDVHHTTLEQAPKPEYYISGRQGPPVAPMIAIRTGVDPAGMAETIRRELRAFDATMPVFDVQTMENLRSTSVSQRRFLMTLVLVFGALAIGLAAVGVYGVMALAVAERKAEVGVRLALGASAANILALVLSQAARLSVIGVAIGLAGALALAPLIASQLFGVAAFDPLTFAAVPALLMLVAIAATLGPARRAMRVDPTEMLRG